MQKWEYTTMSHLIAKNLKDELVYVGGVLTERVPDDKFAIMPILNKLGSQGWELVGFDVDDKYYVFKRPLH